jgi:hypothetical protein
MVEQAVGHAGALAHDGAGDRVATVDGGVVPLVLLFHGLALSHWYGWAGHKAVALR